MTDRNLDISINTSGVITVTPENLDVNEGDSVIITVDRPNNNAIYCALLFDKSLTDQDPFTGVVGGASMFSLDAGVCSTTLTVQSDATVQTNSYTVVLSASQIYLKDPTIKVDP